MVDTRKNSEKNQVYGAAKGGDAGNVPSAKRWLWVLPLFAFVALMVLMYFRLGDDTQITPQMALDRPVPAFSLPNLHNPEQTLTQDDLPKQPFLLNIWGSWCPSCKIEHPFFMRLQHEGVPIIGINYKDELPDALNYLERLGNPYTQVVQDSTGTLVVDLGLTGAPESFVVDAMGNIRQHIVGVVDEPMWRERIAPCFTVLQTLGAQVVDTVHAEDIASVCR